MSFLYLQTQVIASSLASEAFQLPTWQEFVRVISLQDYNTRVVVLGTSMLGIAAGLVGSFTLLRRRALMGDALAHATLPGICIAFLIATYLGSDGKSLLVLLLGAAISGLLGMATILIIRKQTRLKEDAALGIVLSVFFGAGTALMAMIQQMETGHAAGLENFIYGKTASMVAQDARLIIYSAILCLVLCMLLFKEFKLLCFDDAFAGSRGYSVLWLDVMLMGLVVIVTIVGLQSVGLVLIIALMVIPAAAARFWTERLAVLAVASAILGMVCCFLGAITSAMFPRLPSGAMIVLFSAAVFTFSLLCGRQRGILIRALRRRRLKFGHDERHLLHGMYEVYEQSDVAIAQDVAPKSSIAVSQLLKLRSWTKPQLQRAISSQTAAGFIEVTDGNVRLSDIGWREAKRLAREHRLWELYLIKYAEIAPSRVDRDADAIEHVLEPELIRELELALADDRRVQLAVPPDPHADINRSAKSPSKQEQHN
jgi:manganese/zinc/iron transport system permease protein